MRPHADCPLVVAYGLGVDSTALLVEFARRGIRPDLILFADTGGEKPETYAYLPVIQRYLAGAGFPAVVTVRYRPVRAAYSTLEGQCLHTGLPWAADNGAYSGFDPGAFRRMLHQLCGRPRCLFVTCPDVIADAEPTLALFEQWQPVLAFLRLPVAFVAQDGQEGREVPWDHFRALFLGGSTEWKLGRAAAGLAHEARRRGKWLHMGRVNTVRRMRYAHALGCDSVDGSQFSRFPDTCLPRFLRLLHSLQQQPYLWGGQRAAPHFIHPR